MTRPSAADRDTGISLGEMGLERFAPYLLSRAMSRWADAIRDELRQHGLSPTQMRTLGALSVRQNPSIQELSQFTMTEPSTMSRTLDSLEEKGYIRRETRNEDGRLRVIASTEEGQAKFASLWPHLRARYEQMMKGIDESERDAFLTTLNKVARNLERADAKNQADD